MFFKLILAMQRVRAATMASPDIKPLAEAAEVSLVAFGVSGMFLAVAYQAPFYLLAGIVIAVKDVAVRPRSNDDRDNQLRSQGVMYTIPPVGRVS